MELGLKDRLPQAESLGSDVGQRAAGKGLISAPLLQSGFCLSDFSLFFDSGKNPCAARGAALAQLWPTGLLVACGTPSPRHLRNHCPIQGHEDLVSNSFIVLTLTLKKKNL